jgi:hypothetical protein
MAESEKVQEQEPQLRVGPEATNDNGGYAERRAAGGEITSNGVFTKVLRDGHVEIIPTSEVYSKEPDERVQGLVVNDPTVLREVGQRGILVDRLEREFSTQELGDSVSKQHAQGAAGTIAREVSGEVEFDEGAYEAEREQEKPAAKKRAAKKASKKK